LICPHEKGLIFYHQQAAEVSFTVHAGFKRKDKRGNFLMASSLLLFLKKKKTKINAANFVRMREDSIYCCSDLFFQRENFIS
jgi:hypothetical protein